MQVRRITTDVWLALALGVFSNPAEAQAPPCGNSYGTPAQSVAIENAMYTGDAAACIAAIGAARETRGPSVGCQDTVFPRSTPNPTAPTLATIAARWTTTHAPGLAAYAEDCAPIGRDWPAAALGAFYANLAGYGLPASQVTLIADQVEASQYSVAHAPEPLVTYPGLYGYVHTLAEPASACYRPGVVADGVNLVCSNAPQYCATFDGGPWAGETFVVADFFVSPRAYDGGAAFDQGWAGAMMVEAWVQATESSAQSRYEASARLAADWSVAEPAVRNHNYTAKNIWLLAELYAATGDATYRAALLDRLDRSLKPGVLTDFDNDGKVDGMVNQPFSALSDVAQRPGRMWDGHNSILWYQAINTWAMTEAYVALRDRGDSSDADSLRPYVIAMLDNVAWELNTLGPGTGIGAGAHPIPYALLIGLWKVAAYENEAHPAWESALAVTWNAGYFNVFEGGRSTANCGLYLAYASGIPYIPLAQRLLPPDETIMTSGVVIREGSGLAVEGDPLRLIAPAGFSGYQWLKDGAAVVGAPPRLTGEGGQILAFAHLTLEDSGAYSCRYSSGAKALFETEPHSVSVVSANAVPALTRICTAALAGLLAAGMAYRIMARAESPTPAEGELRTSPAWRGRR